MVFFARSSAAILPPNLNVGLLSPANLLQLRRKNTFSLPIQVQKTPNPQSMKFLPGRPVLSAGSAHFTASEPAERSPLAQRLFAVPAVRAAMEREVVSVVDQFFASRQPALLHSPEQQSKEDSQDAESSLQVQDGDDEVVAEIKEILEQKVRPHILNDGGDLVFRGFKDGCVFLQLQGSCVGCSSSSVTLKNMVQNMLSHYVPEVKMVKEWGADPAAEADSELPPWSRDEILPASRPPLELNIRHPKT